MPRFSADYWEFDARYTEVARQTHPSSMRLFAWILLVLLVLAAIALTITPWIQTSSGMGQVTAIDPSKRQHELHTLVAGRVDEWFVNDGDRVSAGDPIVRIVDNDVNLVQRLESEMSALQAQQQAARLAAQTAERDYERRRLLRDQGLASERDLEQARIRLQEMRVAESNVDAQLARSSVLQTQLSQQTVFAPGDGVVVETNAAAASTYVQRGAAVATFLPDNPDPVVTLLMPGRDIPLIRPGDRVRLQFDGWPAVQFSGWPSVAVGTFGGVVSIVEATAQADGRFRIFVEPDPGAEPWPDERFLRFGARVRGWVLLDTVSLGYELWRLLNQFPPNYVAPVDPAAPETSP